MALATLRSHPPEGGTQCVNRARRDLCGGYRVSSEDAVDPRCSCGDSGGRAQTELCGKLAGKFDGAAKQACCSGGAGEQERLTIWRSWRMAGSTRRTTGWQHVPGFLPRRSSLVIQEPPATGIVVNPAT